MCGDTAISPPFFHLDLARAALRELGKEHENLSIREVPTSEGDQKFSDAVAVISQESRWLEFARNKDCNAGFRAVLPQPQILGFPKRPANPSAPRHRLPQTSTRTG
jgi:hypothetical protein